MKLANLLLAEIANRVDALSPAAQAILRPFLRPPIYVDSWFAQQFGLIADAAPSGKKTAAISSDNCSAAKASSYYPRLATEHFNIYYFRINDPAGDLRHAQLALMVASFLEDLYTAETGLLDRFPLPDAGEECNGGDGRVDVYINPHRNSALYAQTIPYHGGCAKTPSYIVLNSMNDLVMFSLPKVSATEGTAMVKAILAHEFMHVLQLAMDRRADCEDTKWFDEATAQWAIDYVDPLSNYEDGFTRLSGRLKRSGVFYTDYLLWDHMAPIEKPGHGGDSQHNGYADYIFFEYLARKYTAATIKKIFDNMAGPTGKASVEAISAALGDKGGFKAVWPEFAATLWNDTQASFLDYWKTTDKFDVGLSTIFSPAAETSFRIRAEERLKTTQIDQKGAGKAKFTLLKNALEFGGDYEIEPRSLYYEHLQFTDPAVHSALFVNPIGNIPAASREFIKVQAWKKLAGQWKPVEDWTAEPYKFFCFDKTDERLEELLIVVSNSEANRGTEKNFRFSHLSPMQLSTSNVGCWQWQGDASVQYTGADGTIETTTATNVTFEITQILPGQLYFETTSGNVKGDRVSPLGECSITETGSQKTIVRNAAMPDGTLAYNSDLDLGFAGGGDVNRKLTDFTGQTELSTVTTFRCPTFETTASGDRTWDWLSIDEPSAIQISPSGNTIEGAITSNTPDGGVSKTTFKFTSKRQ